MRLTTLLLLVASWVVHGCAAPVGGVGGRTDAGVDAGPGEGPFVDGGPFVDVTVAAGLVYVQAPNRLPPDCLMDLGGTDPGTFCQAEQFTGGAAAADYDQDGYVDLYVTRLDGPDLLFRNLGDGTFVDVAASAGLTLDTSSSAAAWGDIDNDGDPDLYVTTVGDVRHYLFINDGAGGFTEQAVLRGTDQTADRPLQSYSVAFGDYDHDGWLDIHTCEWRFVIQGTTPARTTLLHNRGAAAPGYFEDTTVSAGVLLAGDAVYSFSSTFADLDGDGWEDLAIAGDFGTSRLFWNQRDGTFVDGTTAAGVGTDENGMGVAIGDYDGDGRLDWFVTAISDELGTCVRNACGWGSTGNRLYRNVGGRVFEDHTDRAGVRHGGWGWGAAFFDYDQDGVLDLMMANGFGTDVVTFEDHFSEVPLRVWHGGAGSMVEVAEAVGLADRREGRALIPFDYDGDGDLDVFVVHSRAAPALYRNDIGNAADWLKVRALTADGRPALGAVVWVDPDGTPQVRHLGTEYGFNGHGESIAHFGLGTGGGSVDVEVWWPDGTTTRMDAVSPNQTLEVRPP